MVLKVPEGFAGDARTFVDYGPTRTRTARITLRSVPCDSPPAVTEEDQRQLLTSVTFADGTWVALGESTQPGSEWEEKTYERYSTLIRRNPIVDFLGPVDSVEVYTGADGSLGRIDVYFFPTEDFETASEGDR